MGFNHLQLISIKHQIFNVPLNIFLFNNWKKSNACRFLNSYALKWYEYRRLKNYLGGQILYSSSVPPIKNGVDAIFDQGNPFFKSLLFLWNFEPFCSNL